MAEQNREAERRRADDQVRKRLPPGVKLVCTLRGHTDTIGRIAWSPSGQFVASPSFDKTVRIWNPPTGESVRVLRGHTRRVVALAWAPQRIADLSERGVKAAELLDRHFDVPPEEETMTWDNHRWIRLRSFLASLEKSLNQLVNACDHPENGDRSYEQWLVDLAAAAGPEEVADDDKAPSYTMNSRQLVAARKTLAELRAIHELWAASPAAGKAPRPRPVLRPRPQI